MRPALRSVAALLACTAFICLAACGGEGNGAGSAVSLQLFGDPEELSVYRDLAAAYEKETGRRVKLIEVADREAHLQKLSTAFSSGSPPDVFLVNYRNYGGYAARGVLDPAGTRLDRSETLDRKDFYPQPIEAFTFEGELQCMPQNLSSLVVYYNRDMFRTAGLEEPGPDWTYDHMREAAERLQNPPSHHGLGVDAEIARVAPFVWSAGGELVDDETEPTRFTLDSPQARRGLQAFFDLVAVGPEDDEVESKELDQRFLDGELGMYLGSRREVPTFRTIEDFEWDVAPFPRLLERAGVLHSDAYCISKGDRADDAWRFVEFAAGEKGQRLTAQSGRTVPSLKGVARSDAFLDPDAAPRSSRIFLDSVPAIRRLPNSPNWPKVEEAADLATETAFYGGVFGEADMDGYLDRLDRDTNGKF